MHSPERVVTINFQICLSSTWTVINLSISLSEKIFISVLWLFFNFQNAIYFFISLSKYPVIILSYFMKYGPLYLPRSYQISDSDVFGRNSPSVDITDTIVNKKNWWLASFIFRVDKNIETAVLRTKLPDTN